MRDWASSNCAVVRQRSGRQETTIARGGTFPEHPYYQELKPVSNADNEYSDEHESDSKILQYNNDKTRVESQESDNKESLNLGRVFETSNENTFLIGHS